MNLRTISILILCVCFVHCDDVQKKYNYAEEGKASYYANLFIGRPTASGAIFSQDSLTAAHRTLPFGTEVLVTNMDNGKSITVFVNDRGPFVKNRIIDLPRRVADSLDFLEQGLVQVKIKAVIADEDLANQLANKRAATK